ncbi:MAG: class I SAM-dependent methyltransferase [Pseudomonadota bacterium]
MNQLIDTWSSIPEEEDGMNDEHFWIWTEMIRSLGMDLTRSKVLDFGCNQGGFLRLLFDMNPFAEGVGIDIARDAVARAEAIKGDRPITYLASANIGESGEAFDAVFSHEVIYLIEDLREHATDVARVLKPGCSYFAVTCCLKENPNWSRWRGRIKSFSKLPVPDHGVCEIADAFRMSGFDVSVSRFLADAFIPLPAPNDYFMNDLDTLEIYSRWKLMFKMTLPD